MKAAEARGVWAVRMRSEREARGWSQTDVVRALRRRASQTLPTDATLLRNWRRWESGDTCPDDFYAPLIAAVFDMSPSALFPKTRPDRNDELLAATGLDTVELVGRLRISDVSAGTLDGVGIAVRRLCCDYSTLDPTELHRDAAQWLRRIVSLLDGRLTLAQHRQVLVLAGWVALLLGCLEYDLGRASRAEANRQAALCLGTEASDPEILGWSAELAAWFALTRGNFRGVLAAAESAPSECEKFGVGVQLAAQRAKAWARIGDRRQVDQALSTGRKTLERLGHPTDVDNHFVVDPAKFEFYAMDCCRVVGDDIRAERYARQVIDQNTRTEGGHDNPMRVSEAELTLAVVDVRNGELDSAVAHGTRAITAHRRSLPSLRLIAGEVAREITARYPGDPGTRSYLDRLRCLAD